MYKKQTDNATLNRVAESTRIIDARMRFAGVFFFNVSSTQKPAFISLTNPKLTPLICQPRASAKRFLCAHGPHPQTNNRIIISHFKVQRPQRLSVCSIGECARATAERLIGRRDGYQSRQEPLDTFTGHFHTLVRTRLSWCLPRLLPKISRDVKSSCMKGLVWTL